MRIAIAIIVALTVFLALKVISIGIKKLAHRYPDWLYIIKFYPAFELFSWFVYILWSMDYLFRDKFFYEYLVIAFIFILSGFTAWYVFNDIIAGIVFKVKHNLKAGTQIRTANYTGSIKSHHLTYLQIRTDDGQLIRIPYSRINQEVISEVSHAELSEENIIRLQIGLSLSKADAETLIHETIMNSPWSNLKETPSIKLIEENETGYIFEIVLFSMNLKHINFIEQALKENPSLKVV